MVTRVRIALLCLLATLLVVGHSDRSSLELGDAHQVSAGPGSFRAARVVAELRGVNPTLSEPELRRIAAAVMRCRDERGLDPVLVTAILQVESGARPWARSPKGALGLMQVMPHMFAPYAVAGNPTTIETNIDVGCEILADNIQRLGEEDGILSYFWGSEIRGDAYLNRVRAARAALGSGSES